MQVKIQSKSLAQGWSAQLKETKLDAIKVLKWMKVYIFLILSIGVRFY